MFRLLTEPAPCGVGILACVVALAGCAEINGWPQTGVAHHVVVEVIPDDDHPRRVLEWDQVHPDLRPPILPPLFNEAKQNRTRPASEEVTMEEWNESLRDLRTAWSETHGESRDETNFPIHFNQTTYLVGFARSMA